MACAWFLAGAFAFAQDAPAASASAEATDATVTPGVIAQRTLGDNQYAVHVPKNAPTGMMIIVHGTPRPHDVAIELATRFLRRWTAFAEENRLIAIAPAFPIRDFGGASEGIPFGGYRGLVGRTIRADEFVHRLVDRHGDRIPDFDGKFYLYGYSAGGQFTTRYVVTHPQRIKAAVVSAAGAYAFPDSNRNWPNGMKAATRGGTAMVERIRIAPDPAGWLEAATLPITVLVGTEDTDPPYASSPDVTRIDLAKRWVAQMNQLAEASGRKGTIRLVLVDGVGHNSAQLTPKTMEAFGEMGLRVPSAVGGEALFTQANPDPYDLIIQDGRVVDGTGNPHFLAMLESAMDGSSPWAISLAPRQEELLMPPAR